jgi:hypothetical protein
MDDPFPEMAVAVDWWVPMDGRSKWKMTSVSVQQ